MENRVLLFHGWGGSDYPHWQAWLAGELAKDYGTVSFPLIHHPHHPNPAKWERQFLDHLQSFKPQSVICHSLACTVWMSLCAQEKIEPIKRLLLVSPPSRNTDIELLKHFFPHSLPKSLFAKEAVMVVSTNDPYITLKEAREMQKHFGCELVLLENAGHINDKSGYGEWPWVLEWAKGEHNTF